MISTVTATIANAGTTSQAVDIANFAVCGIEMPATITGTALTLHASSTLAGTYGVLRAADGTALAMVVTGGGKYYLDPIITAGWRYVKAVMSAQGQATAVLLQVRPV